MRGRPCAFASRGFVLATGKNRFTGTGPELIADPEVAKSFLGAEGNERAHFLL